MIETSGVFYHETSAWDGGDLLPLAARMDREAAIEEFLRRWPLCRRSQARIDVDLVYTTAASSLPEHIRLDHSGRGQGGVVLAVDASKVPGGLEWFMHEDECDGGYVTDRIPAEAIIGRTDDPATLARIEAIFAEMEAA